MIEGLTRWGGKVALVTGASSGIGQAVACALAEAGMRVAIAARREERLAQLKQELEEGGAEVLSLPTDLRDEASILSMFSTIREQWGGVDVMVNNAGLGHHAPLAEGSTEHWREMLEVNVLALCICTREALQDMKRQDSAGQIIHISSMAAHRVPGGSGVYSATKFAVRSLTEALRKELREEESPIRVTSISPGFVETEFAAVYHKDEQKAQDAYNRFKVLEAKDIAHSLTYILSTPPHMEVHDILIRPTAQAS